VGHESAVFELDPEYFGAFGVMRNPGVVHGPTNTTSTSPSFFTKTMCQWDSAGRVGESSLKVLPCMIDST
jgi:hypothetical protein